MLYLAGWAGLRDVPDSLRKRRIAIEALKRLPVPPDPARAVELDDDLRDGVGGVAELEYRPSRR